MEEFAPYPSPYKVTSKRAVIIGLAATISLSPIALWLAESSDTAYKLVCLALSISILVGCIMWVHIDTAHKGVKLGNGFRLAMILVMIVALPYYLYKSRGAKYGTIALLKVIALYVVTSIVAAFVTAALGTANF